MRIELIDGFELRPMNSMNWQVYEFRKVVKKNGTVAEQWVGLESYHNTVRSALMWLLEYIPRTRYKAVQANVAGYIDELRWLLADVEAAASRLEKAIGKAKEETR